MNKEVSPKEAAAELGCTVRFVCAEIKRRRLYPVFKINSKVIRIPRASLEAYKSARRV